LCTLSKYSYTNEVADISQRGGNYPLPPQAPKTLGVEFSGTVEQLGEDVKGFKKGDKVFGLAYGGVCFLMVTG
jgi:NADPH:quinone reductase-like Zn-dependent oxidoreductase